MTLSEQDEEEGQGSAVEAVGRIVVGTVVVVAEEMTADSTDDVYLLREDSSEDTVDLSANLSADIDKGAESRCGPPHGDVVVDVDGDGDDDGVDSDALGLL